MRTIHLTVYWGPSPQCLSHGHCPCSKHNPNLNISLSVAESCTTPSENPHLSSRACEERTPFNHMEIKHCPTCLVCAFSLQGCGCGDGAVKCSWVHNLELVLTKLCTQGALQKGKWLHRRTRSAGEWHELLSPAMELQPSTSTY